MTDHLHTVVDPLDGSRTFQGNDVDCPFCQEMRNQLEQTTFNQEAAADELVRRALTRIERLAEVQILIEAAFREGLSIPSGEFGYPYGEGDRDAIELWRESKALKSFHLLDRLFR